MAEAEFHAAESPGPCLPPDSAGAVGAGGELEPEAAMSGNSNDAGQHSADLKAAQVPGEISTKKQDASTPLRRLRSTGATAIE